MNDELKKHLKKVKSNVKQNNDILCQAAEGLHLRLNIALMMSKDLFGDDVESKTVLDVLELLTKEEAILSIQEAYRKESPLMPQNILGGKVPRDN